MSRRGRVISTRIALWAVVLLYPLLTAQSCYEPFLDARDCSGVSMELEINGGEAWIPDCLGTGEMQHIRRLETLTLDGFPSDYLEWEFGPGRITRSIKLRSTPLAMAGQQHSFVLQFRPLFCGPNVPRFNQDVEVPKGPLKVLEASSYTPWTRDGFSGSLIFSLFLTLSSSLIQELPKHR